MPTPLRPGDALLIVDVQKDFLPGGRLAVAAGDQVIAPLNRWIARFVAERLPVFATRDWHPENHCSFLAQGGTWPPHCIAGSDGARFADALELPPEARIVNKAMTPHEDAYSGFGGTDLSSQCQRLGIGRLLIGGLATDYCVLNTVQDALRLGYETILLTTAIRAVDVRPGDGARAIAAMLAAGAKALEE